MNLEPPRPLPAPLPGTATLPTAALPEAEVPTLPLVAATGAIVVLTTSLVVSKYLLDAVLDYRWPIATYVVLLGVVGYAPSVWWCRVASRRWASGRLRTDIGLDPKWSDLGWGPIVWIGALGAQVIAVSIVVALGLPVSNNTDALEQASIDRTYVVSLVIAAVVAAPIVEEMVFRGVVLRGLRSRLPLVLAIVVQGVLFGAAHVDPVRGAGNVGLVVVLTGVGIAFGLAAHLLRRIGPSIVAHALFNGVVLLLVLTGVAGRLQNATSFEEEFGVVDQAYVAEASGHSDSVVPGNPFDVGRHRLKGVSVEDADVVD